MRVVKRKFQTVDVNIPNTTGTTTQDGTPITLDAAFDECVGMAIIEKDNGQSVTWNFGLKDKDQEYIQLVSSTFFQCSTGVPMSDRMRDISLKPAEVNNRNLVPRTKLDAALSENDLDYQIVFELVKYGQ